jgi:hypothetical protein
VDPGVKLHGQTAEAGGWVLVDPGVKLHGQTAEAGKWVGTQVRMVHPQITQQWLVGVNHGHGP